MRARRRDGGDFDNDLCSPGDFVQAWSVGGASSCVGYVLPHDRDDLLYLAVHQTTSGDEDSTQVSAMCADREVLIPWANLAMVMRVQAEVTGCGCHGAMTWRTS